MLWLCQGAFKYSLSTFNEFNDSVLVVTEAPWNMQCLSRKSKIESKENYWQWVEHVIRKDCLSGVLCVWVLKSKQTAFVVLWSAFLLAVRVQLWKGSTVLALAICRGIHQTSSNDYCICLVPLLLISLQTVKYFTGLQKLHIKKRN